MILDEIADKKAEFAAFNEKKTIYEAKRDAYNAAVKIPDRKKFDFIEFFSQKAKYAPSRPEKPAGPPNAYTGLSAADWTTKITNYGDDGGWGKLTKGEILSLDQAKAGKSFGVFGTGGGTTDANGAVVPGSATKFSLS
jgi:hypothetical protein